MKKLRIPVILAAIVMGAGVLALAGCDDGSSGTTTPVAGADIVDPWNVVFEGGASLTSSSFTITEASAAQVKSPNPGGQTVEYAASTGTTPPASASEWHAGRTFTGMDADQTYYVFARTAAKTFNSINYAAGTPVMGTESVDTLPEGGSYSVTWSWGGSVDAYEPDATSFYIGSAASAVAPATTVNYNVAPTSTNAATIAAATTGWNGSRTIQLSRIGSTTQEYNVWARATNPVGTPMSKRLSLPGATLTPTAWIPTYNTTSTSVTLTSTGAFTRTPEDQTIDSLVIEYGLATGTTQGAIDAIGNWNIPNSSGQVPITGLQPSTPYYLYARTRASGSFRAGTPVLWTGSGTGANNVIYTSGVTTNAQELSNELNAMKNGSASYSGNTVSVANSPQSDPLVLQASISIPPGVTLQINSGQVLDTEYFSISGGDAIVVNGTLICNEYMVTGMPINISGDTGALVYKASMVETKVVKGGSNSYTRGGNGVLELTGGHLTLSTTGLAHQYTLWGGKAKTLTGFMLSPAETLTLETGSEFTVSSDTQLSAAGTINVKSGGTLIVPNDYDFTKGLKPLSTSLLTINNGGVLRPITGKAIIAHNKQTVTTVTEANLWLDTSGGAKIDIQLAASGTTYVPRYTLSGRAEVGITSGTMIDVFVVGSSSTLAIPKGTSSKKLAFSKRLIVDGAVTFETTDTSNTLNGTLQINASAVLDLNSSGNITINRGGALYVVGGGTLNLAGTISGTSSGASTTTSAQLTIDKAKVTGSGTINFTDGRVIVSGGAMFSEFEGSTVKLNLGQYASYTSILSPTAGPFKFAASPGSSPNFKIEMGQKQGHKVSTTVTFPKITLDADMNLMSSGTILTNQEYILPAGRTLTVLYPSANVHFAVQTGAQLTVGGTVNFVSGSSYSVQGTIVKSGTGSSSPPQFVNGPHP